MKSYFLDLFSGIGGFALGASWAGLRFNGHYYSEVDKYACEVYGARFPDAVPLGDVRKIRETDLPRGRWVVAGGFPCQDISCAGKGAGLAGSRSGLWREYARIVAEIRPTVAVIENVGALVQRGLAEVLTDLASLGYDAEWADIRASDVGAPHRRERIWIVAYPDGKRWEAGRHTERGNENLFPEKRTPEKNIEQWDIGVNRTCSVGKTLADSSDGGNARRDGELGAEQCAPRNIADGCSEGRRREGAALADAERDRLQGAEYAGARERTTRFGRRSTNADWWATEPDVGGTLDGFSTWLDRLDGINAHKYNMTYGTTEKERPGEILRALRSEVGAIQNKQQARRSECISSQEVLFAYLCELEARLDKQTDLFVESAEAPQGSLRSLRDEEESPGASCGSKPEKQSTGKYSDSLQALPRLLALDAEKAWISYRRENASAVRHWESGIARVAHGVPARVDRLKCLGNSIVPQIAKEIFLQPIFDEWRRP